MSVLEIESFDVYVGPTPVVHVDRLDVRPGEIVAVVGPAAVGKSLLLRGIFGLQPTTGSVLLGQRELGGARAHERVRHGLGYVPQHGPEIPELIVDEILDLPQALRSTRRPGSRWGRGSGPVPGRPWSMYDLDEHLPGLGRVVHADVASLGAWDRVALGVALSLRSGPHALLLDEPAAGLGDVSTERLRVSLTRIAATGIAMVVATRNLAFARAIADHTREVAGGRVVPWVTGVRAR